MARLSLISVLIALTATVNASYVKRQNPFEGIPDLSLLPVCTVECQPIADAQANFNGDLSQACTATFANALGGCLTCLANSAFAPLFLTTENLEAVETALTEIETRCAQAGTPVTIDLSTIITRTDLNTGSASDTASANAPTTSTGGASGAQYASTGFFVGLVALVGANLF